jgi:hypothetical protein
MRAVDIFKVPRWSVVVTYRSRGGRLMLAMTSRNSMNYGHWLSAAQTGIRLKTSTSNLHA